MTGVAADFIRIFVCPNGHYFGSSSLGELGERRVATSQCPECKEPANKKPRWAQLLDEDYVREMTSDVRRPAHLKNLAPPKKPASGCALEVVCRSCSGLMNRVNGSWQCKCGASMPASPDRVIG